MSESSTENKHEFQAEVSKLLHMMVHSVYSEREVFLRELISNAADACDKLRYLGATQGDLIQDDAELKITLIPNAQVSTLTIKDNGIGMSKEEMAENLGTIARSGTKSFIDKIEAEKGSDDKAADHGLIGQFGVGFYAAFMVADKVDVISHKAGEDDVWHWSSDGMSGYDLEKASDELAKTTPRGTTIILHIKDDAKKFLETDEIEHIVKSYSDHVSFPIELLTPKAPEKDEDGKEVEEASVVGEEPEQESRQLNTSGALWARSKSEITPEQYKEFYNDVASTFDEPSRIIHYTAEGRQLYTVLLFVPKMKPFDLFEPSRKGHIKLYVRKVFITDDADLLPNYLRFVRGVIDSEDMPLNLSREMLQNNPIVGAISKAVTNKVLSELKKMANKDSDDYQEMWDQFGTVIKEGLYEDHARRDDLYELARFHSTKMDNARSLKAYVADMVEGQDRIFYMTGDDLGLMKKSPQLEGYKAKGIEVLLFSDPIDSFWISTAAGFDGKQFQSITQGEVDLSAIKSKDAKEDDKDKTEEKAEDNAASALLVAKLKEILAEKVQDVKISSRLVDSPVCLVAGAGAPDRVMEKLMQMRQAGMPMSKPVLEINSSHKLLKTAQDKLLDGNAERLEDLAFMLLDEAVILEGGVPEDPTGFAERLNRVMMAGM